MAVFYSMSQVLTVEQNIPDVNKRYKISIVRFKSSLISVSPTIGDFGINWRDPLWSEDIDSNILWKMYLELPVFMTFLCWRKLKEAPTKLALLIS